jgi:hypothetical protein
MPSQLNRRSVFAALSAFVLALAVAYALSSTGEASPPAENPGQPAQPLDVASGVAGQTTLGEAQALPALVRKPKPPPKKSEPKDTSEPATSSPAPTVTSTPSFTPPATSTPSTSTPPTQAEPPVQFEDSG